MKIFKNMKIGQKVGIGFSIILVMMAIILALNIVSNVITYSSTVRVRDASNIGNLFNQLNMEYSEARLWANAIYIEDSDVFPGYFEEAAEKVESSFDELLDYITNCNGLDEYGDYVLELRETFRTWKGEVNNSEVFYGSAREATTTLTNAGVDVTTKVEDLFRRQLLVLKDESTDTELFQNHVAAAQVFNNRSTMIQQLYENTAKITAFRRRVSSSIANFNAEEAGGIAKEISGSHISIKTFKNLYGKDPSLEGLDGAVDLVGNYLTAYLNFAQIMQDLEEHINLTKQDGEIVKTEVTTLAGEMNELLEQELGIVNSIMMGALFIVAAVSLFSIVFGIYIAKFLVSSIKKPIEVMSQTLLNLGHDGKIDISEEEMVVIKEVSKGKDEIAIAIRTLLLTMERLQYVGQVLETVANGDLQVEVELLSLEDSMGKSLDLMVNKLDRIFTEIAKSANEVTGATFQISDGAQELAQGSAEQAATVEELTTAMEEISKETMENDSRAQEAAGMSKQILEDAAKGNSQMSEMLKAVHEINEASNNIGIVIKTIDDIAFQTNILALNAAVEAARAGEAGKGFAVVAQEVRNLATKSASAAKETDVLIQNSIEKTELGATIAGDTAKSLEDIVKSIEISAEIINKISKSSRAQANSITEINKGIEKVSDVVNRNSSTAEESAASSEEMSTQAVYLKENVSQFKLKQEILL